VTIYLVIDYGQYGGMDVKKYARAVDALEEVDIRDGGLSFCPVIQIIHGQQLTTEELRRLVKTEAKKGT